MEPACRKDKPKLNSTPTRGDRAKQKSAQQELKQRQRAEIYALNKMMTELEQQQFEAFCKQMQSQGEWRVPPRLLSPGPGPVTLWTCELFTHTVTDSQPQDLWCSGRQFVAQLSDLVTCVWADLKTLMHGLENYSKDDNREEEMHISCENKGCVISYTQDQTF